MSNQEVVAKGGAGPSSMAWVFPGQGSQVVGMGKPLYDLQPEVRSLYDTANQVLGYSISDLCFNGPADLLQRTDNAQPALLVTEVAHLTALRLRYPGHYDNAAFVAGHSLGEYAALVAAGVLAFEDALMLVAERGRLMNEAGSSLDQPTGMIAVLGLPDEAAESVSRGAGVDLANLNAPGQIVLSGPQEALAQATELAEAAGARRVVPLQVSAAFHSRWMRPISEQFALHLGQTAFAEPEIPVVANVTARPAPDALDIRRLLEMQTYSPVRWVESVQYMVEQGVTTFVEVGPGKVLSGLIKRIARGSQVVSSEDLLS
ncbi:MAG: ACP S-malonyltransferase [Chloroflexota bacterium]|nr:ACP S-malonyltransferase [Chloroflexota bacterium]